jgi:diguanylate cyclase (GGDEF)-like protein
MDRQAGTLTRATLGALIAATAFAAIALCLGVVRELAPYEADVRIPWWVLAAGFAVTEVFVVHAHVRGSAHSLSLSELPLVLGLLLAKPIDVVIAIVIGPAIVLLLTRGHGPVRLVFNLAQYALTAALAAITLHVLIPAPAEIGPGLWGATFVAVVTSSATAVLLVFCAIGLSERSIQPRRLAGMLGATLLVALTNTSVALSCATAVAVDSRAGWLLLPPAALLLLAYRAYVSERAKHQSLEFLYGVARSLSRGGELEPELLELLGRARSSFRVQTAELVLLPGEPGDGALRTSLGPDDREEVMAAMAPGPAAALRAAVEGEHAVLEESGRCAPELGRYLAERGIEQALVAPVRGETRLIGVMVLGDREDASAFSDEDVRLFEALANHAGVSLEFDRLERQAQSDPLTGLANRTLFMRRVEASLARPAGTATVLFLDLDDFKAVNDRTGHAAGDAVLIAAAGRIGASVRPHDLAARMGGDEFAVLLEDVDDYHAEQVAGRIVELLADAITVEREAIWVRSSVGIAAAEAGSLDAAELLRRADVAMYQAKEAGKGRVRVWAPEMQPAGGGVEVGREQLAAALKRGELIAHFQPIVSLESGVVVAMEALARWQHPRHGLLGPGSFVAAAEAVGLDEALDLAMLKQACAAAVAGAAPTVHVNASAPPSSRAVMNVLDATGLEPSRLVLELSERALAVASPSELARLRVIGVRIALDDFGTGHAALQLLQDRRLDMLKIAKPFVDAAVRTEHDRALISMLLQLGAMFDLEVVAEGIEREDQRETLADLGCELGQGHLLGRPVPLETAIALR